MKQRLRRIANSLVTRMIVFGLALVVAGAIARYHYQTEGVRRDLIEIVSAQQTAKAEALANDLEHRLNAHHLWLQRLAAALPPTHLRNADQLQAWLAERRILFPTTSPDLLVIGRDGQFFSGTRPNLPQAAALHETYPVVGQALAGTGGIGRIQPDAADGKLLLPIAIPLKNAQGEVEGALVSLVNLDSSDLLERIRTSRIGQSGGYLLIDPASQLFIAAGDPRLDRQPTPPTGVNLLHDRAMAGFRGTGITVNARGQEELSAMVSVPSAGWFVVARIPTAEAFEPVARAQQRVIIIALISVLIIFLVVGVMMRALLRPLFKAAELAERMTHDEIPLAPLPVVRDDEIGHLTEAFNRLLDKLARTQEALAHTAAHDILTGLPNRALLADRMNTALALAQRHGTRVGVLFLDLDGFKPINDTLGHDAGDMALIEVARRLKATVRESDTLARVGGDEFVVVLGELGADAEAAVTHIARKCIEAVAQPLTLKNQTCPLGVSIGVAISTPACNADSLLIAADTAMYDAKNAGRGCFAMARATAG